MTTLLNPVASAELMLSAMAAVMLWRRDQCT